MAEMLLTAELLDESALRTPRLCTKSCGRSSLLTLAFQDSGFAIVDAPFHVRFKADIVVSALLGRRIVKPEELGNQDGVMLKKAPARLAPR